MLIVKKGSDDKQDGNIFVELVDYRDRAISGTDCNQLGYWCDKPHLRHFLLELGKCFTEDELREILDL